MAGACPHDAHLLLARPDCLQTKGLHLFLRWKSCTAKETRIKCCFSHFCGCAGSADLCFYWYSINFSEHITRRSAFRPRACCSRRAVVQDTPCRDKHPPCKQNSPKLADFPGSRLPAVVNHSIVISFSLWWICLSWEFGPTGLLGRRRAALPLSARWC